MNAPLSPELSSILRATKWVNQNAAHGVYADFNDRALTCLDQNTPIYPKKVQDFISAGKTKREREIRTGYANQAQKIDDSTLSSISEFVGRSTSDRGVNVSEETIRARIYLLEEPKLTKNFLFIEHTFITLFGKIEWTNRVNEFFRSFHKYRTHYQEITSKSPSELAVEFFWEKTSLRFDKENYLKTLGSNALKLLRSTMNIRSIQDARFIENEALLLTGTLISAHRKQHLTLQDFETLFWIQVKTVEGHLLEEGEKMKIMEFYRENYSNSKEEIPVLQFAKNSLDSKEPDSNTRYYLLSLEDTYLLTFKLTEQIDGSLYFGTFNARSDFRGLWFGELVLKSVFDANSDKEIRAVVLSENTSLLRFYEKMGFHIKTDDSGKPIIIEDNGLKLYEIVRPKNSITKEEAPDNTGIAKQTNIPWHTPELDRLYELAELPENRRGRNRDYTKILTQLNAEFWHDRTPLSIESALKPLIKQRKIQGIQKDYGDPEIRSAISIRGGNTSLERKTWVHGQSAEQLKKASELGALARWQKPWSKEEDNRIEELRNNPEYLSWDRLNTARIAETLNKEFHNSVEIRTNRTVSSHVDYLKRKTKKGH